jgi:protein-disulfide isomerase
MYPKMSQEMLRKEWDKMVAVACTPTKGDPKAEWIMLEIGDFQCPQCGKQRLNAEKLVANSKGQMKLAFINWPLTNIHSNASSAALASLAGESQGKFWEMYDAIYSRQEKLEEKAAKTAETVYLDSAKECKLDINKFNTDRNSPNIKARLASQSAVAPTLGLESTPTFLLRKKGSNTVYYFIGGAGQKETPGAPAIPGLETLMVSQPWNGGKLDEPFDPSVPPQPAGGAQPAGPAPMGPTGPSSSASGGTGAGTSSNMLGNSHTGPVGPAKKK